MSSINSTSSMASELLLNKIMNGQVQTENGKTVTAGLRANSAELSREATKFGLEGAAVRESEATVTEYQNNLTEMVDYLTNLDKKLTNADEATTTALMTDATAYIDKFVARTVDGAAVFGGAALDLSIGNGETMAIGGIADTVLTGAYAETTDSAAAQADVQTALNTYMAELTASSQQVQTVAGRSALFDDLANTYSNAASQQYTTGDSGVSDLLNNILA